MLKINSQAPDFTLEDQDKKTHSLSDYKDRYVLIYFYPKDDTPGCTKEACVIRDMYSMFEQNNVKVLGISADSTDSHRKFADKYSLPFTLLADPNRIAISAYGAKGLGHTKRISYLIGPDGVIVKTYPKVDPAHHGAEILKDILALKK